jgi:integrase
MSTRQSLMSFVEQYLTSRRKLGFVLHNDGFRLRHLARYADKSEHRGPLKTEFIVRWAKLPKGAQSTYLAARLDSVRRFARYLALFDPRTEIPPEGLMGPSNRRLPPHIYSEEQIASLLKAASKLGKPGCLEGCTFVTLFGLLVCTGLRISEALRLSRDDVDLQAAVITVKAGKFRKSRLVPLHLSTAEALDHYSACRDRCYPLASSKAFFLTEHGQALNYSQALRTFTSLRAGLGWTGEGERRPPRIHDLRHTFAVRRLLHWYEAGLDVDRKMAALATYLGHVCVTDTYWYLSAVPELLAVTAARFEQFASQEHGDRR